MRQQRHPGSLAGWIRAAAASLALQGSLVLPPAVAPAQASELQPELITLPDSWPTLQEPLNLPEWAQLQLSYTAEPLFNPIGGKRSAGSWIQETSLHLTLGTGLNATNRQWSEFDHWRLNINVNHDAGDAVYNEQIGTLFSLRTTANPIGFYFTETSIERKRGEGWLGMKGGILPFDPEFVAAPVLNFYVHASLGNLWATPV